MKPIRPKTPAKKFCRAKATVKDPIGVYCRIRPLENRNDPVCVRAGNENTVILTPPDSNLGTKSVYKEFLYSFKYVFDENTTQKELFNHVALPLVQDLLQGTNGLLFTYGITSSGKTYTMAGTPEDSGLLPRTLDVIFNSIQDCQAEKYVFKSDKFNGFEVQSTGEALLDQQKELTIFSRTPKQKRTEVLFDWNNRIPDTTKIDNIGPDVNFAVFISYVEIYNNYIYDLLEEPLSDGIRPRFPQSKILREDLSHNMYVFGTTETEVKNVEDALELFCKGQQRRRISHTALNAESSRSHSVFTVRVTQAPLDPTGAEILQAKDQITVSQLSLVDLAGSERSVRTKNTGHKLREAGNINNSLMALRTCIEILRENQYQGASKMVPYRDSKLTQLFKSYFEGEGKIRMIVCVNPKAEDFDETTHVMRFAEATQDVLVPRPTPVSTPVAIGMRTGRGNLYREAVRRAKEEGVPLSEVLAPVTYSLGPEFPSLILNFPNDESTLIDLIGFLSARNIRRLSLIQDLNRRQADFRNNLITIDKENVSLKQEKLILQMDLNAREQQVRDLERKLSLSEQTSDLLQKRLDESEKNNANLKCELREKEYMLREEEREKGKIKSRWQDRLVLEKDRMRRIMEKRLAEKQAEIERKMCFNEEKFRQLREILNTGDWEFGNDLWINLSPNEVANVASEAASADPRITRAKTTMGGSVNTQRNTATSNTGPTKSFSELTINEAGSNATSAPQKSIAVANPRHRRSQSSSGDVWIEHKPIGSLELGTVLQPKMKKKKSVSKLEVKDMTKADVSKYVLTHQEQDSKGEMETKLYKGDVIPSAGGGAQVIFNDVEKLRQESPPLVYNLRKRSAENVTLRDVESRCTVAVECHGMPSKVMRKAK